MFGDISGYWSKYHQWILDGVKVTLLLSLISIILGTIGGIIIAYFRHVHISRKDNLVMKILKKSIKYVLDAYMLFFRYTPFIAQAFFFYFALFASYHVDGIGVFNKPFIVGFIVLSMNVSAFIAKTMEGGLLSINEYQYKAGRSLGLSHRRTFFTIVLPQAFKNIVPQLSNEFVNTIKATSVLSIIGVYDLMKKISEGNTASYTTAPGYTIAILIYFVICLIFSVGLGLIARWIQRRR